MNMQTSNNYFYLERGAQLILTLTLLIFTVLPVTALEYLVTAEEFEINGRSREAVLLNRIGPALGKTFQSAEELEVYRLEREQDLENLRAFEKSAVRIEYDSAASTDTIPVKLVYQIEDGNAFFPIPIAFYNSNAGFQGGVLLTMSNIGGTLQNGLLMGLYIAPPDENEQLKWLDPNFFLLGTWSGIELSPFQLRVAVSAKRMNEETTVSGVDLAVFQNTAFTIAPGLTYQFTDKFSATATARAGFSAQYSLLEVIDPEMLAYGPLKYFLGYSENLEYSDINWTGNFRDGLKASVTGNYLFTEPAYAERHQDFSIETEVAGYRSLAGRFGPSFRVYASANSGLPALMPAAYLRGIRNGEFAGNLVVAVNSTLQVKLARFGAAELHLSPSLDWGLARQKESAGGETDSGFGAGAELLLVLDAMKNFPIKLGFAYDLRDKHGDDIGSRVEVDFNFSFTY